jgi:ABC-2 type transport system permease protein
MSGPALPASIWQRELIEFEERRRALAVKLLFPLLIAVPLLFSRAPGVYAAMALTMLAATVGALGSGAVLSRERALGLTARYRLLPRRPAAVVLERVAAGSAIDLLQMLAVLVLVAVRHPARLAWFPGTLLAAAGVLAASNVLGAWASTVTRSPGEVMLAVLLPLLPALFLSGVFTAPSTPLLAAASRFLPFTYLHDALLGALDGRPQLSPLADGLGGLAFLLASAVAAGLLARRVLERD